MATTKLTLSIAPEVIGKARRIAGQRRTSISSLFSNYIAMLDESGKPLPDLPPLTKRALELTDGTANLPDDWDYRSELTDSMVRKYGDQ